eukprot:TRINITY_DN4526_c0_g1_i1.p2 TRINITY_DN4526_c0_g1~~TRINITY_DN4526_c0_g1_i1.p2  ORF type:complete len:69 (+),score=5.40 TRINITY_DN4526_c0_g1_i1:64-270(+)
MPSSGFPVPVNIWGQLVDVVSYRWCTRQLSDAKGCAETLFHTIQQLNMLCQFMNSACFYKSDKFLLLD